MEKSYYEVTVTNGVWEEIKKVSTKYAESQKVAERMVTGLMNNCWRIVEGKTKLVS